MVEKEINGDRPVIVVNFEGEQNKFYAEEITAMILKKMKKIAEEYLGRELKDAVITVPLYFNEFQRQQIKEAGMISGLNVIRIISEPIADIAYGYHTKFKANRNFLIFDLGGGTLDVTVLSLKVGHFDLLARNRHSYLGGRDFDSRLVEFCTREFRIKNNLD